MSGYLLMKGPLAVLIEPGSDVLLAASVTLIYSFILNLSSSFPVRKVIVQLSYQNV